MMLDETNSAITQLTARSPSLFKRLPERIFAPLASANRWQYWHLLCALYDKRFGQDAPLPPGNGFLLREITHDIAAEIQHQQWVLEEVEATPQTPLVNRAYMVFSRLRDSGWLQVERVGVREMVTMPPEVAHFMNRLVEFAHTGPEFVSGKIRSIEANLRLLLDEDADGASLQEAARQSRALLEHIRIASTHVRDLMREIGDITVTGEFVRRFFDDYVERIFIADYKELRTREHPLARRQEILRLLGYIRQTALRERLLRWYREKQAAGDAARAEALFARDIQKIEELQRIDEYLNRLDDEIRRANRQALAYLDYRLRATLPLGQLIGGQDTRREGHPPRTVCLRRGHQWRAPCPPASANPAHTAGCAAHADDFTGAGGLCPLGITGTRPPRHVLAETHRLSPRAACRARKHHQRRPAHRQHRSGTRPANALHRRHRARGRTLPATRRIHPPPRWRRGNALACPLAHPLHPD